MSQSREHIESLTDQRVWQVLPRGCGVAVWCIYIIGSLGGRYPDG